MTLLGKIFTVLIFFMSVLFLGFSITVYATHVNWHKLVNNANPTGGEPLGLKQQVDQKQQRNQALEAELEAARNALAEEQAARRHVIANLYSRLELLNGQLETREGELRTLKNAEQQAQAVMVSSNSTLKSLRDEVNALRTQIRAALEDRDQKVDRLVALTDKLNGAEGMVRSLREKQGQLAVQITKMRGVMNKLGIDENTPTDNRPPALDGLIVKVAGRDLVEISLGSDDGLRKGHELDVYRDGTYLGRVRVLETHPDRAAAMITKKEGIIKRDDRVSTRLRFG